MDSCKEVITRVILCMLLSTCSYYQKVPEQVPDIPSGVVYGLATPEDLSLPPHNPLWTEEVYTALSDQKPAYPAAGSQEIAPVPEPDIAPGATPAPKTESSCVIA